MDWPHPSCGQSGGCIMDWIHPSGSQSGGCIMNWIILMDYKMDLNIFGFGLMDLYMDVMIFSLSDDLHCW